MTPQGSPMIPLVALVALGACSAPVPDLHDFSGVKRVVVTGLGGGDTLRILTSPDSVAALVASSTAGTPTGQRRGAVFRCRRSLLSSTERSSREVLEVGPTSLKPNEQESLRLGGRRARSWRNSPGLLEFPSSACKVRVDDAAA